jgi:hypothetical protein
MTLSSRSLAGGLLLGCAATVQAQSSVELSIEGLLIPASCTPTLGIDTVDFGKLSKADLEPQAHTPLTHQHHALNIRCAQPTRFALRTYDNRQDSVHGKPGAVAPLGLGMTPDKQRLGAWHLELVSSGSSVDGKVAYFTLGDAEGSAWSPATATTTALHSTGPLLGLVDSAGVVSGPAPIRTALLRIQVSGHIAPADGLSLVDEVPLDGHATVELVYL